MPSKMMVRLLGVSTFAASLHREFYGEEYEDWWNTMKRKMRQDRFPGWKGNTAAQWAAIHAYPLATPPVPVRAALWLTETARGEPFTECLDFLLKDIAKK